MVIVYFLLLIMLCFSLKTERKPLIIAVSFVSVSVLCYLAFTLSLLYGVVLTILFFGALGYHEYHCSLRNAMKQSDEKKAEAGKEKEEIKTKLEIKEDSLGMLTEQVNEIFQLFELAKEFNECLNFQDALKTLTTKVVHNLSFSTGLLITLEGKKRKQEILDVFSFSPDTWEEYVDDGKYDLAAMISHVCELKTALRIDQRSIDQYSFICQSNRVKEPMFLYPLIVEEQVIGLVVFEEGLPDAFSKFSIIAGQLSLLVKKITLYNTVRELSITDGLTGVFLRRHFIERFNEELKRSIKNGYNLSVLMLDIDHFKTYNDTFGHLVGDVTLREVSHIIGDNVRKVDLISRYGGEEFAIILPETDLPDGIDAAERIRSAVSEKHFEVYDEQTRVTVSIGVSSFVFDSTIEYSTDCDSLADLLIQQADKALYQAKNEGRDRVISFSS